MKFRIELTTDQLCVVMFALEAIGQAADLFSAKAEESVESIERDTAATLAAIESQVGERNADDSFTFRFPG